MASRRPNPGAEKAAANQQVIKSLLKLPGNKFCADCKRNKLPRWASWNLGIFICIRYDMALLPDPAVWEANRRWPQVLRHPPRDGDSH